MSDYQDINLRFNIEDVDHDTIDSKVLGKTYKEGKAFTRLQDSKKFLFGRDSMDSAPPIGIDGTIVMLENKGERVQRRGKRALTLAKKPSGLREYTHGIQDTISPLILGLEQMVTPSFYFDPASRIYDKTAFESLKSYINSNGISNIPIELKDIYGVDTSIEVSINEENKLIFNITVREFNGDQVSRLVVTIDDNGFADHESGIYISGNKENAEYFSNANGRFDLLEGVKLVLCKLLGDLNHLIYLKAIKDANLQARTLICTGDSYLCDRSIYNDVKGVIYRSVAKSIEKVGDVMPGGTKGPKKITKTASKFGKKLVDKTRNPRAPSILKYVLYENVPTSSGGVQRGGSIDTDVREDIKIVYGIEVDTSYSVEDTIGKLVEDFKNNEKSKIFEESSRIDLNKNVENLWRYITVELKKIKHQYNDQFKLKIIFEPPSEWNLSKLIDNWTPKNLYELTLFMNKAIEFGFKDGDKIIDEMYFLNVLLTALTNENKELADALYSLLTRLTFVDGYRIIDVNIIVDFINIVYEEGSFKVENITYSVGSPLHSFLAGIRKSDDGEQYEYIEDDEDTAEYLRPASPASPASPATLKKPENSKDNRRYLSYLPWLNRGPKVSQQLAQPRRAARGGKKKTLKKRRTRKSKQTKNKRTRRYKKTP